MVSDRWGLIDNKGKGITPIKYDEIIDRNEPLVSVKVNGRWGFLDKSGTEYFED